jgi:hypothetical protein
MTDTATLISQLRVLAHLTRTEAQVARLRTTQATSDGVREELQRNAADADVRSRRIGEALRGLGALPDPVTPVLGGAAALVRGALEQAQPLDEALFGDLALEHQLRDRARHARALADAAGLATVRALADDLVSAHTETVDWLYGVLDDVAAGRPAALAASPLQRVAAQVTRTANAPARPALDEAAAQAVATGQDAVAAGSDTMTGAVGRVAELAGTAEATAESTAEATAPDADTGPDTTGTPSAPDPAVAPVPGFAEFSTHAAVAALRTLDRAAAAAALAFEQAHENRAAVVAAARIRAGTVRAE